MVDMLRLVDQTFFLFVCYMLVLILFECHVLVTLGEVDIIVDILRLVDKIFLDILLYYITTDIPFYPLL